MKNRYKMSFRNIAGYCLAICCSLIAVSAIAQTNYVKQVIILNEGPFGGPVTLGSYDPQTKTYQAFDTIFNARFGSDVIIDNGYIYAATDSFLVKYDLNTLQKVNTTVVKGIRELSVWNNQILVTRAEVFALPSYFQVYDKNSLSLLYELNTLSGSSAEVKVLNNKAYIAVNNWGSMGKLAVVDLQNQIMENEIDLGTDGLNPENVVVDNGKVITVNSLDWTDASVSKYDAGSTALQSTRLGRSSGCSGSSYYLNNVYFQTSGEDKIGVFSTLWSGVWDSLEISKQLYGIEVDPANALIYIGETDYFSYGNVMVYDLYGNRTDSFAVGVSPSTFAFDVRNASGIQADEHSLSSAVVVYPNPATTEAKVLIPELKEGGKTAHLQVMDVLGKELWSGSANSVITTVPFDKLEKGIYLLKIRAGEKVTTKKITKE